MIKKVTLWLKKQTWKEDSSLLECVRQVHPDIFLNPTVFTVVNITPCLLYPGKESQYLLHRRLGGPHSQPGQLQKILPLQSLNPGPLRP
jgi:hypothetical protein